MNRGPVAAAYRQLVTRAAAETTAGTDLLIARYLGVICDLDGVVYRGATAVPGAVETVNRLTADDVPVVFATNNASRSPTAVGHQLRELGVGPLGWSVVTSSQAAAAHLAAQLPERTRVFAVGGPGVAEALSEVGLVPVRWSELDGTSGSQDKVAAVVQGLGVDVTWRELAEVGYLVQDEVAWVATNLDPMLMVVNEGLSDSPGSSTPSDGVWGSPVFGFETAVDWFGFGPNNVNIVGDTPANLYLITSGFGTPVVFASVFQNRRTERRSPSPTH